MSESTLVRAIKKAVKKKYPRAYLVKLADRHHKGLPDLLLCAEGVMLFVETKVMIGGVVSPIQHAEHEKIINAGGWVSVCTTAEQVMGILEDLIRLEQIAGMNR